MSRCNVLWDDFFKKKGQKNESKHTAETYQEKWSYLSVYHWSDINFSSPGINGEHSIRWSINPCSRDSVCNLLVHFAIWSNLQAKRLELWFNLEQIRNLRARQNEKKVGIITKWASVWNISWLSPTWLWVIGLLQAPASGRDKIISLEVLCGISEVQNIQLSAMHVCARHVHT
jgi:hypothetical protein